MKRGHFRRPSRWLSVVLMTVLSVSLWSLSGMWYTAARASYLTAQEPSVALAGAQPLPEDPERWATYGVVSAARALDEAGQMSGFVVITAVTGYKSVIRVQTTLTADGERVAGVKVLSQQETEYLGSRIATEAFAADFFGRRLPVKLWTSAAPGSPVDGLSGSTVSAQAVVTAVNQAYGYIQEYLAA